MTITNISNIKNDALIAVANQLPLTLVIDSQTTPTVVVSISSNGNTIAQNLEMINYKTQAPFYYFTMDIKDIVSTLFVETLEDSLQSAWTWQNMINSLFDIRIVINASNTANETASQTIDFTAINIAKQFGSSSTICESPNAIDELEQDDVIYVGYDNLGYAYVLSKNTDEVSTSIERLAYFIDSDDFLFTVEDNDKMTYEE